MRPGRSANGVPAPAKPVAFVIFATQRTGSSWLMDMLDSHPAAACYDELLLGSASGNGYWGRTDLEFFEPYYARHSKRKDKLSRARWAFRYLHDLYAPRPDTRAIGMKLMYDQLWRNPSVLAYIVSRRVRVVHLVRHNLLDIVISLETVAARKRPHAWQGHTVDTPAVHMDTATLADTLTTLDRRVKFARLMLHALPIKHVEVSYEQLMATPALMHGVFEFLGLHVQAGPATIQSKFKKLNTASRSELISNHDQVRQALKATRFRALLDDEE